MISRDMKLNFYKYHGTGNDFILIDNRNGSIQLDPTQISFLCNRHFGIGADGLMMLTRSSKAEFRMIYFNADGFEGSMCGNGGRCIASFANKLGIAGESMKFEAVDGLHEAMIMEKQKNEAMVMLKMQFVSGIKQIDDKLLINTGSPHLIIRTNDLPQVDVETEGQRLRFDKSISEEGVNVNFISIHNELIQIRTYERGVEHETLSCGTGVTAAGIAASWWHGGRQFTVRTLGGDLQVSFTKQGSAYTDIQLLGPAHYVFKGEINV